MTTRSEAQTISVVDQSGSTPATLPALQASTRPAGLQTETSAASSADSTMSALPPLEPGTRFGAYRILGELGIGGMGQVYQAVQGTLERLVALKVMRPELAADPQFSERFVREARAAASVCHQHVVVIFDAGTCDGRLYMAFQFVPGGDLDAELARRTTLGVAESLVMIAGCCDGLQAIHEAGLVHRDIKPHNIFLDAKGRPKLGDFGLARQAQGADRMTMTGVGMGTPAYMAPEQAQGLADVDIRADIHALGGTLYTLLTGKPPFSGLTPWMVVNAVCNEPAPDPRAVLPDLPEPVAAIVLRCLAKKREERYATPADLRTDLLRVHAAITGAPTLINAGIAHEPLPRVPLPIGLAALQRTWLPMTATVVAVAALPLGLRPLLQINDYYRAATWSDAGWWAGFVSVIVTAGVLLTTEASTRRDRLTLSVCVLAGSISAWLACWFMTRALLTAGDGLGSGQDNSGWESLATWISGVVGVGFFAWHAKRWWATDPHLAGRAYPRALASLGIALLITLIAHLTIADRPLRSTVREESHNALSGIRRAFGANDPETSVVTHPRSTGAAQALAWLAPLTVLMVAPTFLAWRERRRFS